MTGARHTGVFPPFVPLAAGVPLSLPGGLLFDYSARRAFSKTDRFLEKSYPGARKMLALCKAMVYTVTMVRRDKMTMVKRGEKVRDCYGKVHTVLRQNGTTIYTYTCGTERIHASNCWRVKA